jgi:hypothetical protein
MSIPTKEQASRFLAPLRGSLTIMLLHDIQAKMRLTRFLLQCSRLQSTDTAVLDTDTFYCTNLDRLAEEAQPIAKAELLLLPEQDFEVASLMPLLSSKIEMLIIDDLNSLYSLASDARKSHQLTILMKLLSHNARMNGSWIVATAFTSKLGNRQGAANQRSLTSLGDLLVDTEVSGASIQLKASWKGQWPNGEFSL